MKGYQWNQASVYHPIVDPQQYGYSGGALRRSHVGGSWSDLTNIHNGSRSSNMYAYGTNRSSDFTIRGCNENKYYPGAQISIDPNSGHINEWFVTDDNMWMESPICHANVDTNKNGMYEGFLRRQPIGGSYIMLPRRCGSTVTADITIRGCNENKYYPGADWPDINYMGLNGYQWHIQPHMNILVDDHNIGICTG